jgi:hypothetical protein
MADVRLPNGVTLRFPDTMSVEDQEAAVRQYLAQQEPTAQPQMQAEPEKGIVGRTVEWFKGGQRDETIPLANQSNLGLPPAKAAEMTALLATTASDDRLKSGVKRILPDAEFDTDKFGNLVVIAPVFKDGEQTQQYTRFYPNPKGLDVTDIMQASGAVAAATGLGKTAQLLGVPAGYLTAGGLGATEAGLVEAASAKLSDDRFKFSDLIYGAFGGALGQGAVQIANRVANIFRRSPAAVLDQSGKLRPSIAKQMQEAGLDPEQARAEMAQAMAAQVRAGVDPAEAGRLAAAETLPVPVPLTSGAVTGAPSQQLFEDMARKGAYGQQAETMMQGRQQETLQALQENIPAIQQRIAGTTPVVGAGEGLVAQRPSAPTAAAPLITTGEGGAAAQQALLAQRQAAQRQAGELYDVARASGPAFVEPQAAAQLADDLRASVRDFTPSVRPVTTSIADEIDDILAQGGDIKTLFQKREQLTNAGAFGTPEQAAASKMKAVLDQRLSDLVEQSLIRGDETAIASWERAIENYSDFAKTWKSKGGILNTLTEQTVRDGEMVLKQPPEAAAAYILGASNSKLLKPSNVSRDILTLKKFLPEVEWNQLRQEAFINLAQKAQATRAGEDVFSGVNFLKSWKDMSNKNPEAIKALFTPEERNLINQFATVAARATGGAVNASNSAAAASGLLQKLAAAFGSTNAAYFLARIPIAKAFTEARGAAMAYGAGRAAPTPRRAAPIAGAGGVLLSSEEAKTPIERQIERTTGFRPSGF